MKSIVLNISFKCNNNCKYCPVEKNTKKEPSIEQIKSSIEKAKQKGYEKIILEGGEPLLRKDIFEIIDYIKQRNLAFEIKTNGRLASYLDFARKIALTGPDKIIIYFPSSKPEVFDDITQVKGSYFQTLQGIENLISFGVNIEGHIVVSKKNYKDLKDILIILRRIGVKDVRFEMPSLKGNTLKYFDEIVLDINKVSPYIQSAQEFREKLNFGRASQEIQTYVQVNTTCNQKCVFCNRPPTEEYRRSQMIQVKDIKKRIDELAHNWQVKRIIFTGGEPTLHPKLPEIISFAKKYGFKTEIQTNGTLLNEDRLKELKEAGLDIINFAYHSHKKEISNKLRGVNFGFEKINENLKLASKMKFEIHMIHVINSLNYKDLPEFIDFVNQMKLHNLYLNLSIVVPEGWAWENRWIIPRMRDIKPYLQKAMKKCQSYGIKFDVSEIVPLCIMEEFEEHAISTVFKISRVKIADDYYTGQRFLDFENPSAEYAAKAPQCKNCTFDKICAGFYPRLKELYGVSDFQPRTDDPTPVLKKLKVNEEILNIFKGKEIEVFHHKKPRSPDTLYINLDERCNQNCVFCVVKGENVGKFGSMPKEEAEKIIKDFISSGGRTIVFTGGEPTLRDDLAEIIDYAEKFDDLRGISIITNGVRLSDKNYLKKLLEADRKHKMSFCFSLHSHKKEISELLTRAKGTFEKTIKGLENVIQSNRVVSIYQVITSKNYRDLLEFCRFLNKNYPQIREITFAYPFPQGNALLNDWIFTKISSLRPYLIKALKFLEEKNYRIYIAACGQFPLCCIPGFEETVLRGVEIGEEDISGVVGKKAFHEFEMASDEWVNQYKGKSKECQKCILRTICQGFWKKYIELFGFDGIQPVSEENFKGNKLKSSLRDENDFEKITRKLKSRKLNLVILDDYDADYLMKLINFTKLNKIFLVVTKQGKVLYPKYYETC